ncbi:dynamin-related protein 4C-like protein [Tanacetum coccineum]
MDVTSLISRLGQDLNISVPVIVVIGDKDSGVCPEITDNNNIYKDIHYLTKMFAAAKDAEINLVVEKKGLPDLIIVDLPHVSKVLTKQMEELLLKYMNPEEAIILNVISSKSQFKKCKSTELAKRADPMGRRTLLAVTCTNTEGNMIEEVLKLRLKSFAHCYVREMMIKETYEHAELQEAELFTTNLELSSLDKSVVGVDLLVRKIVKMHSIRLFKWLPVVSRIIDDRIKISVSELKDKPVNLMGKMGLIEYVAAAMDTLHGRFIRQDYNECSTDLIQILHELLEQLQAKFKFDGTFLTEEMILINEATGEVRTDKKSVVHCSVEKYVSCLTDVMDMFIMNVSNHLETITKDVVKDKFHGYPELNSLVTKAATRAISKMKDEYNSKIFEKIEYEKRSIFTADPDYVALYNKLMDNQTQFSSTMNRGSRSIEFEGHGRFKVGHLLGVPDAIKMEAFGLKMKATAYIHVVIKRVVDFAAVQLYTVIDNIVIRELHTEMRNAILLRDDNIGNLLQTSPSMAAERMEIERKIDLLLETKKLVTKAINSTIPRQ